MSPATSVETSQTHEPPPGWRAPRRPAPLRARSLAALASAALACAAPRPPATAESAPPLVATAAAPDAPPEAAAPDAPGGSPGSSAAGPAALPVVSPEADTSLELAVYHAAGVPELDRPWSARDYERCFAVFADLARSGRGDLPRRGSPRSGPLFARLVARDNFATAADAAPAERARRLQGYLDVYPGLLQAYSPANDGIDFSVEQVELIAGLFELLKSALDSSRSLASKDPAWGDVYVQQQRMTLGVVRGASAMLAEPDRYALPLRRWLRAELARLAPAFERHLDPDGAREVHALASADPDAAAPR